MNLDVDARRATRSIFVVTWVVLLVLAGVSLWTAFLRIGFFAPLIEFAIAGVQVAIVFIVFMRLKGHPSIKWVFAAAGFCWLLLLFGLTATDYSNRVGWPPASPRSSASISTDR